MSERPDIDPSPHLLQEAMDIIAAEFERPTTLSIDYVKEGTSKTTTFIVEADDQETQYVLRFDGSGEEDGEPTIEQQ